MFRTLFFLRLECGQECVVALLTLTYQAIMLQKKEERGRKTGDGTEGRGIKKERKVVQAKTQKTAHYY